MTDVIAFISQQLTASGHAHLDFSFSITRNPPTVSNLTNMPVNVSMCSFVRFFPVTTTNENLGPKTCSSTKVSGLQRSQEQSNDVSFVPPISSPTPASPPTGSPAPAAAAAPPPRPHPISSNPLSIKKESLPPIPTPPLLRNLSHPQEHRIPPPSHHSRAIISHHHPSPYSSLHDIRLIHVLRLLGSL